jgi:two-component system OmpR family response regulator
MTTAAVITSPQPLIWQPEKVSSPTTVRRISRVDGFIKSGGCWQGDASDCKSPSRVLVVDNDPAKRGIIADYCESHSLRVFVSALRIADITRQLAASDPDVIVMDLPLGQSDWIGIVRQNRSCPNALLIVITGHARNEEDRAAALELGADDYVARPFSLRELVARIRAVLRGREWGRAARRRKVHQGRYRFDGWRLDYQTKCLTDPAGRPVRLTKGEFALLMAFVESPQRHITRDELLTATRAGDDVLDRSIDAGILRLRRKLLTHSTGRQIIQTERGLGYRFAIPVELL